MKARIVITDESGETFEGEAELTRAVPRNRTAKATKSTPATASPKLDFSKPLRAFVKSYAPGHGGPRKFVLLVAYLAKGQEGREVQLRDVETRWNKMTALLGGKFNRFYSGQARDNGWVDTKKTGVYVLLPSWRQALS